MRDWLNERGLPWAGTNWVIGVSGGADSVLLARALGALRSDADDPPGLHVAHLHHGLRGGEADADTEFVERLARELGMAFFSERDDVAARARESSTTIEETGRRLRYEFFERVALSTGSTLIGLGHQADDNAETVLHRIIRGTGLKGLAGIPAVRPIRPGSDIRIVRPFIDVRRAEIESMCAEAGLAYRTDHSNTTNEFTRGLIRNRILPELRETVNPNVSQALLRLARQARRAQEHLDAAAARAYASLVISEATGEVVLPIPAFLTKDDAIQAEIVRLAICRAFGSDVDVGFSHTEAVLELARDSASGKQLHVPGPVVVQRAYERLVFRPLGRTRDAGAGVEFAARVHIACPGRAHLPGLGMSLTVEVCDVTLGMLETVRSKDNCFEEWLDYDAVRPPLLVRARCDGDRFRPLGAGGSKSLSDFFIDHKAAPEQRDQACLLCDQTGPIWVMPMRIEERVKIGPQTRRALHLTLSPSAEHRKTDS